MIQRKKKEGMEEINFITPVYKKEIQGLAQGRDGSNEIMGDGCQSHLRSQVSEVQRLLVVR